MQLSLHTILFLLISTFSGSLWQGSPKSVFIFKTANSYQNNSQGFVVVELFTSEGCSSCPPADGLVAKIQQESKDQPIYILSFHVDYWNKLGWKDVFSNPEFSNRQKQYAAWLHIPTIYTPQVVINGKKEFIGSDEATLRSAIYNNLTKPATAKLILDDVKLNQTQLNLTYHTDGNMEKMMLLLAIVEKSAITNVKRGENSGHILTHVQIVRKMQNISLSSLKNVGTTVVEIPKILNVKELEVIAFLQNKYNGEIFAAAKSRF